MGWMSMIRNCNPVNDSFSFEYKISQPKVCCLWGKAEDGGKNFSGLVGDLFNGYTDIAWAQLFFTLERSQFIDYTDAYMFDYGGFMVRTKLLYLDYQMV